MLMPTTAVISDSSYNFSFKLEDKKENTGKEGPWFFGRRADVLYFKLCEMLSATVQ
jgi:hypothetical protein